MKKRYTLFEEKCSWEAHGPWDFEFDVAEWEHSGLNRRCIVCRVDMGNLNGYVEVTNTKLHGEDYDKVPVDVHGGLAFGSSLFGDTTSWWFGFDTAHAGDLVPRSPARTLGVVAVNPFRYEKYRSWDYVTRQTRDLGDQLHAIIKAKP